MDDIEYGFLYAGWGIEQVITMLRIGMQCLARYGTDTKIVARILYFIAVTMDKCDDKNA